MVNLNPIVSQGCTSPCPDAVWEFPSDLRLPRLLKSTASGNANCNRKIKEKSGKSKKNQRKIQYTDDKLISTKEVKLQYK